MLIDTIILENPNLDPYGKFIETILNKFNYCKLNEYSLKLEINTLEETNLVLKNELEQMKYNIEQSSLILNWLKAQKFGKHRQ
jgi:hypothetical protein